MRCAGKDFWPELLGAKAREARSKIESENDLVKVVIVKEGTFVTHDYRCDRVRVWVDKHGTVTRSKTQDLKNAKMAGQCVGKEDWPELLGAEGTVAKETIERENSTVKAEIVLEGTIVPADLVRVCDRVRVWVDTCGIVTRVPTIG
ncbi:hypothetical protein ACLB2K_035918 [Fragaria x ananassa]